MTRAPSLDAGSFMEQLPVSARQTLDAMLEARTFEPGEILLREGQPTTFLGIVRSGRVALRLLVPGRGPTTVLTIEEGELVGWSALVPPYRATATAVALVATDVAAVDAGTIQAAVVDAPAFAAALFPGILETVAGRLGESWSQLLDLFGGSAVEPW
jgi:CRP/FNR family cyclic AMP-dependent transcriptional regulator